MYQLDNADYTSSKYTELTKENPDKVESRLDPSKMLNEDELKKEWKEHPELYDTDCYRIHDLSPQLMHRSNPDNQ